MIKMWIIDWLTSLGYQQEDLLGSTVSTEGRKHVRHTMQNIDAAIEAVRKNARTKDLHKTTGKRRV